MFRCFRAGFASFFCLRPSRCAARLDAPPCFGLRPWLAVLVAGASAAGLLACSDSVWEPPYATGGDQQMVAPVVSQTGLNADVDSLPSWETVVQGIGGPGCEFYFRRATGSYVSRKYELEYSSEANSGAKAAWARLHSIWVTVKRPRADGSEEVLPQQLAIWAVCLLPGTERGKLEVNGSVKAILKELGFEIPDKIWASARPPGGGRWATLGRLALGWTAPRSLFAAQTRIDPDCFDPVPSTECVPPEMEELVATVTATCPGLDLDAVEGSCSLSKFVLDGIEIIPHTLTPVPAPSGSPGGPKEGPKERDDDGDDDGDDDTETAAPQLDLSCRSVTRGDRGGCSVTTRDVTVTLSALTYAWETGARVARPAGTGSIFSSWYGTATSTRSFTVAISGPDIAATTLNGTVTVEPRTRSLVSLSSVVSYTGTWTDGTFGRYDLPTTTPALTAGAVLAGSGPWDGEHTAGSLAVPATILIHQDFRSGAAGYPGANLVPADPHCQATSLPAVANPVKVNGDCGSKPSLDAFESSMLTHEGAHQVAIAACLNAQAARGDQAAMETLVMGDPAVLRDELADEWRMYYRDHVLGSTGGAVAGFTSQWVWDYWNLQAGQRGAGGTAWVVRW